MHVLVDNSITGASQICEWAMGPQGARLGPQNAHWEVLGLIRKMPHPDVAFQAEADALFTVGRLMRKGQIEAYTYNEIGCERMWQPGHDPMLDALAECRFQRCAPAIERSRFQGGLFPDYQRKGGKKDRKRGVNTRIGQIPFMEMLCQLNTEGVSGSEEWVQLLKLTEFDVESLKRLKSFQQFCKLSGSREHYPDIFHWWTAQRNRMDVFLSLDFKFANLAKRIAASPGVNLEYPTEVLRPLELLARFGINEPDHIPIPHGRFFTLHDLWSDAPNQRFTLFRVRRRD